MTTTHTPARPVMTTQAEARRQTWLGQVDRWAAKHGLTRAQVLSSQFCDNTIDGIYGKDLHAWAEVNGFVGVSMEELGLAAFSPIGTAVLSLLRAEALGK